MIVYSFWICKSQNGTGVTDYKTCFEIVVPEKVSFLWRKWSAPWAMTMFMEFSEKQHSPKPSPSAQTSSWRVFFSGTWSLPEEAKNVLLQQRNFGDYDSGCKSDMAPFQICPLTTTHPTSASFHDPCCITSCLGEVLGGSIYYVRFWWSKHHLEKPQKSIKHRNPVFLVALGRNLKVFWTLFTIWSCWKNPCLPRPWFFPPLPFSEAVTQFGGAWQSWSFHFRNCELQANKCVHV